MQNKRWSYSTSNRLWRREAKLAIKVERNKSWAEYVEKGSKLLRERDSKQFFRWSKRTIEGSNSNFVSPLKDEEAVIQLDPHHELFLDLCT